MAESSPEQLQSQAKSESTLQQATHQLERSDEGDKEDSSVFSEHDVSDFGDRIDSEYTYEYESFFESVGSADEG